MVTGWYADYPRLHKKIVTGQKDGNILVSCCSSGAGGYIDRMKGIVSSLLLAMITDRALLIDWVAPAPLLDILAPNHIDWSHDPWNTFSRASCLMLNTKGALFERFNNMFYEDNIEESLFMNVPVVFFKAHHLSEIIESVSANPHCRDKIMSLGLDRIDLDKLFFKIAFEFLFKPYIKDGILRDQFELYSAMLSNHHVVGIQVRTGGDGRWDDPEFAKPEEVFRFVEKAKVDLQEQSTEKPVLFFLTTDSETARDMALQRYGNEVFVTGWPILHLEKSESHLSAVAMKNIIAEHLLFSRCQRYYLSPSGFGAAASWLSKAPALYWPEFKPTPYRWGGARL